MIKTRVVILFLIFSARIFCQEAKLSEIIKDIAEDLASSDSDPEAATAYFERLYELALNPVNINSSSADEISRLIFLSDFQVKALVDYTHSTGRILSFNELAYIPGFDRATAEMMLPFCTIDAGETKIADSVRMRNFFLTNLAVRTGNYDSAAPGSALKILTKYKFRAGRFSGGITLEKDPGEKFIQPGTISPDFFSGNIAYNGNSILQRVIIGDYSARFGHGTNINTDMSKGLSLTSQGYMSANNEIKPYTSADENIFFRGMAAVLSYKNTDLSILYSKNSIDATLGPSSDSSNGYIETLYKSGIHNASSLLMKKDAVTESVYGLNLSYNFSSVRVGLTWSENRFSLPVQTGGHDPGKVFSFNGSGNNVYSFYYSGLINRILIYGELSANDPGKFAIVQGLSLRPSDRITVGFLFRKYNPGYISFHGRGPGNTSGICAEQSIAGNFSFEAARHLFISGGCDFQNFPWLKYRCSSPSRGVRREIRIKYIPSEKLVLEGLYGYRLSMYDNRSVNGIPGLGNIITRSFKFTVRHTIYDNLILGTRIDFKAVEPSGSSGVLLLEDLTFRFRSFPVTLWFRYSIFTTDDYDSRIYTWENDLLYSYSIPSVYGRGNRLYLMIGWKISGNAELRFKYGILTRSDDPAPFINNEEFRLQIKIFI